MIFEYSLENAFLFSSGNWELMKLEVALISEAANQQIPEKKLVKELTRGSNEKIKSPYNIISFDNYVKMKLSILDSNTKKLLVKKYLNSLSSFFKSERLYFVFLIFSFNLLSDGAVVSIVYVPI